MGATLPTRHLYFHLTVTKASTRNINRKKKSRPVLLPRSCRIVTVPQSVSSPSKPSLSLVRTESLRPTRNSQVTLAAAEPHELAHDGRGIRRHQQRDTEMHARQRRRSAQPMSQDQCVHASMPRTLRADRISMMGCSCARTP